MQKISKKHYWLRQIRRPLCLALIVLIVFCHGFVVSADDLTFREYFQVSSDTQEVPALYSNNMSVIYTAEGKDFSKIFSNVNNIFAHRGDSTAWFNAGMVNNSNFKLFTTINYNGVTVDYSNSYTVITGYYSSPNQGEVHRFNGNGKFCYIDGWVVSDSPFIYTIGVWYNGNYNFYISSQNVSVSSAQGNGLYCYNLSQNYTVFTDMNVYLSSSDGGSGFTTFTLESTDFDFDAENYNFNYVKTGDLIISPADPLPMPEGSNIGQHYTYAGIDAYFTDGNASSVILNYNISPNEYMRLHPYEYDVNFRFYAVIVTNDTEHPNIRLTYSYNTMQGAEMAINNNRNYTRIQLSFDQLESNEGYNLADALKSWWGGVTGASENYYNENGSVISFGGQSMNDASRSFGGYRLNPNLKIEDIYFGCRIYIQCNAVEPKQDSGVYEFGQYLISGERKQQLNTISQNMNPPEIYDPQYPAQITDGNGNTIVNGTPVNTYLYNNLQAMVEHLFNIDASDINNIGGNMHNMYQGLVTELSNTSQSGFWGVLKQTYTFIPDEIWNWIKIVVGFLLGGTVVGWAYNGWRIKGR